MGNTKIVYFFLWFNFNLGRWVPVNMCYTSADRLHFFLYSLSSLSLKFLPPLLGWRSQNAAMTRALSLPFVVHPTQSYDGSIKIRYIFNFLLVNLLCTFFFCLIKMCCVLVTLCKRKCHLWKNRISVLIKKAVTFTAPWLVFTQYITVNCWVNATGKR